MVQIPGDGRSQLLLLPKCADEYGGSDNPFRFIDAFVDSLDLSMPRSNSPTLASGDEPIQASTELSLPGCPLFLFEGGGDVIGSVARTCGHCHRNGELPHRPLPLPSEAGDQQERGRRVEKLPDRKAVDADDQVVHAIEPVVALPDRPLAKPVDCRRRSKRGGCTQPRIDFPCPEVTPSNAAEGAQDHGCCERNQFRFG